MKLYHFFTVLYCLLIPLLSQAQSSTYKKGEQAYFAQDYQETIKYWEMLLPELRTGKVVLGLAYSHARVHHPEQAVFFYEQQREKEWPFSYAFMLDYGNVLRQLERYEEAKSVFKTMKSIPGNLLAACDWVLQEEVDDSSVELKQIPVADVFTINGFSKVGDRLLLPVLVNGLDYQLQWIDLESGKKTPLTTKKTWPFNLNSPQLIGDSLLIYSGNVSHSLYLNRKALKSGKISQKGENKLFVYQQNLNKMGIDSEAYAFNDPDYGCTHPFMSQNGKRLYFVSDMPGGYGGFDLYYSELTATGWGDPVNLGSHINSAYDEGFPYVNDNILFFSSKGHMGYGGYDIFMLNLNDTGSRAVNLKKPFNSSKDDIAYHEDNLQEGYFVSNRGNQQGKDQLWHFTRNKADTPAGETKLSHFRFDKDQLIVQAQGSEGEPQKIPADLVFTKVADLQKKLTKQNIEIIGFAQNGSNSRIPSSVHRIPTPIPVKDRLSKEESRMELALAIPDERETIQFEYLKDHCLVTIKKATVLTNIPLVVKESAVRKNRNGYWIQHEKREVRLPFIYFDFDQAGLSYSAMKDLHRLANFMKEFPQYLLEVRGFTDAKGSERHNLKLSEQRGDVVKGYLQDLGIALERISFSGEGVKPVTNEKMSENMTQAWQRVALFRFFQPQ